MLIQHTAKVADKRYENNCFQRHGVCNKVRKRHTDNATAIEATTSHRRQLTDAHCPSSFRRNRYFRSLTWCSQDLVASSRILRCTCTCSSFTRTETESLLPLHTMSRSDGSDRTKLLRTRIARLTRTRQDAAGIRIVSAFVAAIVSEQQQREDGAAQAERDCAHARSGESRKRSAFFKL